MYVNVFEQSRQDAQYVERLMQMAQNPKRAFIDYGHMQKHIGQSLTRLFERSSKYGEQQRLRNYDSTKQYGEAASSFLDENEFLYVLSNILKDPSTQEQIKMHVHNQLRLDEPPSPYGRNECCMNVSLCNIATVQDRHIGYGVQQFKKGPDDKGIWDGFCSDTLRLVFKRTDNSFSLRTVYPVYSPYRSTAFRNYDCLPDNALVQLMLVEQHAPNLLPNYGAFAVTDDMIRMYDADTTKQPTPLPDGGYLIDATALHRHKLVSIANRSNIPTFE